MHVAIGPTFRTLGRSTPHAANARVIRMADADRHVHFEQCAACGGIFLDAGEHRELSRAPWVDPGTAVVAAIQARSISWPGSS